MVHIIKQTQQKKSYFKMTLVTAQIEPESSAEKCKKIFESSGGRAFVTDNFCTANVSSVRQRPAAAATAANVSSVRLAAGAAAATAAGVDKLRLAAILAAPSAP